MHHALQTGVQHGTVQVNQAKAPLAELKNLEQILPAQERPARPCDGCSNVMHNASQISAACTFQDAVTATSFVGVDVLAACATQGAPLPPA